MLSYGLMDYKAPTKIMWVFFSREENGDDNNNNS